MLKLSSPALALALIAAASLAAQTDNAASPRGPRHGRHGGPFGSVIRALDANHDGVLSSTEIANAAAAIRTLDRDGDGAVSASELGAVRPADAPPPPADAPAPENRRPRHVSPVMLALDANEDHALSATEIANAPAALLALDANGDGQLTGDELRPLPPVRE